MDLDSVWGGLPVKLILEAERETRTEAEGVIYMYYDNI